ncbi:PREDICTED: uncharacterized protein LOC109222371, partial [Nicotiana attenuata]|uniref:uncharacterized protein LOC109222371 n=1 Tax=Nicotiana attenuata TaxID=49451 RepID=UPI000904FD8C
MKDSGRLKYFLGVEVSKSSEGIFLSQRKYALDIISVVGLLGAKPVGVPLEQNHRVVLAGGRALDDPERYRRLIDRPIICVSLDQKCLTMFIFYLSSCSNQKRSIEMQLYGPKTKKQYTVSRSSAEAEYHSMEMTICKSSSIARSKDPVFHERTKHIEVDYHFIPDEIDNGNIRTSFMPSHEQLTDIFTKALGKSQCVTLLR